MDRPLSVVALGWDVVAPGILANDGTKPNPKSAFAASNLEVRFSVSNAMSNVEEALARGGGDATGADVAIVPFPSFIEAYERLRALSPEVFFVVGFSRGREAFASKNAGLPTGPTKGGVKLVGTRGASATFLGLFLLDVAGVASSDIQIVVPGDREEKDAGYFAFERIDSNTDAAAGRKIVLTTADTPRLVPIVAVAPRGLLAEKERAMTALAKGWLEGIKKLGIDPPGGARRIAEIEGAPEPLPLLRKLGETETATLSDNARFFGLSGRSALTLPVMFQRTWQLYRGVSFVSTPPPDAPPISAAVITALARSSDVAMGRDNRPVKGEFKEGKDALVVYRQEKLDEDALVNTIGLLAAVFERSVVRVSIAGAAGGVDTTKTKKVIEAAEGQYAVEPGRLVAATKAKARGASVEVMALP
ncbi:MAG: hypothetical protein IPM54_20725 [Polyangiaceae bacterium]|nr:hypothetical protein [Polyangiaceae bacterium]